MGTYLESRPRSCCIVALLRRLLRSGWVAAAHSSAANASLCRCPGYRSSTHMLLQCSPVNVLSAAKSIFLFSISVAVAWSASAAVGRRRLVSRGLQSQRRQVRSAPIWQSRSASESSAQRGRGVIGAGWCLASRGFWLTFFCFLRVGLLPSTSPGVTSDSGVELPQRGLTMQPSAADGAPCPVPAHTPKIKGEKLRG